MSSANPLLDDILSDAEALQRDKARAAAARAVAKTFPVASGAQADLIPQWIPSHYELHKIEQTCDSCGEISTISSSIFFVETHLKTPSTLRKARIDPLTWNPIPGIPLKEKQESCSSPACPTCLEGIFYGH